jgi:3-methyl-2-oxobutanoate hydroxymethyltransferase
MSEKNVKKNILSLQKMKEKKEKVTWITSYDYPMSCAAQNAGIDMILIGDSGGMVQLGYRTTNPVTMDEMISFSRAVKKGADDTFLVGDMPQGSYEISNELAVTNALRFVKEAGCDCIKLEGGKRVCDRVKSIVNAGIPVIGHLGLTPQSTSTFGGYKVQGKTIESFEQTREDALALQNAGVFSILLEAMPEESAAQITRQLSIPIYGIGAGKNVDGQLIIMHDALGFYDPFRPWFAKCYLPEAIAEYSEYLGRIEDIKTFGRETRKDGLLYLVEMVIRDYIVEVKTEKFPSTEYIYPLKAEELALLKTSMHWLT